MKTCIELLTMIFAFIGIIFGLVGENIIILIIGIISLIIHFILVAKEDK